ncbi:MAG: efflux RND transporter periplasmic adaptor subunit [Bacteroidota bacterium]
MKTNKDNPITKRYVFATFLTLGLILITSCNADENSDDPEEIKQKISEYNQQIVDLNQKVTDLENKLEDMGIQTRNRQKMKVTAQEIKKETFTNYVTVKGTVEAVNEATISPETNGQIRQIMVKKGEMVEKGQTLARLNTSVIENNIAETKSALSLAETVYQRQKRLWDQEIGSEIQYLEAKNNFETTRERLKSLESQLEMSIIKAPFNGIIDDIFAKEGELAMPGNPVMHIVNLNNLYVNAEISESFLPLVNQGDRVILRFPSYPDFEMKTTIHRLGNTINPENRTFTLQLLINNQNDKFKPNMVANISVNSFTQEDALVIPSINVKQDTQGYYVYLAHEENDQDMVSKKVYIERGENSEGKTVVKEGLKEGDLLIREGHNQVSEGTLIEIIDNPLSMAQTNHRD